MSKHSSITMPGIHHASAVEVGSKLRSGELSVEEYANSLLEVIDGRDPSLHAWAHIDRNQVIENARALDNIPVPRRAPLHGLPVGIKDIFLTSDMPTRFNSPIYANSPIIAIDAAAVSVLRSAGALVIGKTETTQFASTTHGGPCRNPHNLKHTPGGSSSGSAAAVADFHVPLSIGTQTGGSIVRPASFCGVWGLKPTWGTVSTEGMSRYSTSCDTVGYFARSVDDLDLIASVYEQRTFPSPKLHDMLPRTAKVAMLKTHVWPKAGPGLITAWEEAKRLLTQAGYTPEEVELPVEFENMTQWHANFMGFEGKTGHLGHYLTRKDQLDSIIVSHLERGLTMSSDVMRETYNGVARLRPQWDDFAAQYDMIITPSTTDSAPEGLEWTGDACFNAMWSALHPPCVNVPGLKGTGGLPLGLTVVGARWSDEQVLRTAATLGKVLGGAKR